METYDIYFKEGNDFANKGFSLKDKAKAIRMAEDMLAAKNLFYQGDKSRHSRKHYGMGLYLAEQFAKENGGSLTLANSTRMKGAWVRLRIAKESQK